MASHMLRGMEMMVYFEASELEGDLKAIKDGKMTLPTVSAAVMMNSEGEQVSDYIVFIGDNGVVTVSEA